METSRICVKNLPRTFNERQLLDHFANFGSVTDAKLMHNKNGTSRGFGFIGFLKTTDAEKAVQHFNKTFIGTHRILVEIAKRVGDSTLDRPWSKYSKGSSRYSALHPEEPLVRRPTQQRQLKSAHAEEIENNEELKEFLELMTPSKKLARWEEDQTGLSKKRKSDENQDSTMNLDYLKSKQPRVDEKEMGGRRLFVRNLAYSTTEEDLIGAFGKFGELLEVHLVMDVQKQRSKGFAFIEFIETSDADEALKEMDSGVLHGRLLHVLPSYNKRVKDRVEDPSLQGLSSFKKEKELKLKEEAGKRVSWNTFYMRPDTIMEAIADFYQISKTELMEKDASDLGVRLALGETQIISKTKEDLQLAGVDVSKLEEAAEASGKASEKVSIPRMNDAIIVKNLPYSSSEEELYEMFSSFGEIKNFFMPSTRVLAIVHYHTSPEAKRAFQQLAYKKYKSVPIYLEWAPRGLLATQPHREESQGSEETSSGSCIFVKNLSFSTTDQGLQKHFDHVVSEVGGQIRSARVTRRQHSNGSLVSAGYGFIEVDTKEVAKHVIRKLNHSTLDGHLLELRRSLKKHSSTSSAPHKDLNEETSSKLIVKNLAFECTRKDLIQLFSPFGQMQKCRLPRRFDGQHRGFAFLEFLTKEEAQNAKERLLGSHLYGRRLNIEFSKDQEQQLETL